MVVKILTRSRKSSSQSAAKHSDWGQKENKGGLGIDLEIENLHEFVSTFLSRVHDELGLGSKARARARPET